MPLLFMGTDGRQFAAPSTVLAIAGFSQISCFALYQTGPSLANDQYIFHVSIAANNNQRLALRVNGSTNFRWGGRRLDAGANSSVNATPAPAANTLYALTGIWDYTTNDRALSVDGSKTTSNYSSAGTLDAGSPNTTRVGVSSAGSAGEFCDGVLHTLMFWQDHVLTDAERDLLRVADYSGAIATAGSPLYWWKLEDSKTGLLLAAQAIDSGTGSRNLGPGTSAPRWWGQAAGRMRPETRLAATARLAG